MPILCAMQRVTTTCTAIPDAPEIGEMNPIHGAGAKAYGYRDGIVSGIVTYGWASTAFIEALGESWLDHGWAEVAFRRPVYGGDVLTTNVELDDAGVGHFVQRNDAGAAVLEGRVGLSDAPWRGELKLPRDRAPVPALEDPPVIDAEALPLGCDYRPMRVEVDAERARAWARRRAYDLHPRYLETDTPRIHPSWIAGQITPLVRHSYRYIAGIHAAGRIQHVRAMRAGGAITVAARWIDSFLRKGKRYAVSDGVLVAEDGSELACVRQQSIFLPAH